MRPLLQKMFAIVTCTKTVSAEAASRPLTAAFLPSLNHTVTKRELEEWDIRLYICVDDNDALVNNGTQPMIDRLRPHIPAIPIKVLLYPHSRTIPHGLAAVRAFSDGATYVHRTNDDTRFLTSGWITASTAQLTRWNNVGVVGPVSHGDPRSRRYGKNKNILLTRDVVHKNHMRIFSDYYPKCLHNWYVDDWISHSYALHGRAVFVNGWRVKHAFVHTRYKPSYGQGHKLKELVDCGVKAVNASMRNDSLDPVSCC